MHSSQSKDIEDVGLWEDTALCINSSGFQDYFWFGRRRPEEDDVQVAYKGSIQTVWQQPCGWDLYTWRVQAVLQQSFTETSPLHWISPETVFEFSPK